jgi:uncharacterized phosphosugar-binding protein
MFSTWESLLVTLRDTDDNNMINAAFHFAHQHRKNIGLPEVFLAGHSWIATNCYPRPTSLLPLYFHYLPYQDHLD